MCVCANIQSYVLQTDAGSAFDNLVTLTFGPQGQCTLTAYYALSLPILVLTAQDVFLLEDGHTQTDKETHKITHTTGQR